MKVPPTYLCCCGGSLASACTHEYENVQQAYDDLRTSPLFFSDLRVFASAPSYSLMKPPATSSACCFSNSLYGEK